MKLFYALVLTFSLSSCLFAKGGVDIATLIKPSFSKGVSVSKKQFKLSSKEVKTLQNMAKASIKSNTIRLYTVKKGSTVQGYAVLLLQTVRSKKTAVLYVIGKNQKIKNIEIVAFNEPREYKPKENWLSSFDNKGRQDNLFSGKGIPTISGATLSARAVSDLARVALAVVAKYK